MGFRKTILVITILLICSVTGIAVAEENPAAAGDPKTAPCQGLKPFNNLDELLYQFYINFDSECLFEMPVEELEKVWGIKILFGDRAKPGKFSQIRDTADFLYKPYASEKDAFYVEIGRTYKGIRGNIIIRITDEYYKRHVTLFPDGSYPKLVPGPLVGTSPRAYNLTLPDNLPHPKLRGIYWFEIDSYCWFSSDKKRQICLEGYDNAVTAIEMIWKFNLDSIKNNHTP